MTVQSFLLSEQLLKTFEVLVTYDKVIVLEWVPILAAVSRREVESRILLVG